MARRTDNIHKRKDGRWEGRYKIGNSNDGKTKYRSVYGKTYTEVKNKMYDISIASTFMPTQRRDLKFSELLSLWFNANSVKHKGSTENKYLWTMEKHIIPELGNLKLSQINSSIINGFLKRKLVSGRLDHKGGLSASTVKGILIIIDAALKYGVAEELCSPLKTPIYKPAQPQKQIKILDKTEQAMIENKISENTNITELGIAVTASTTNAVRYKTQQNFKTMLTMQLNDVTDYSIIVGKTDGLIPSKYKGRGLIALDRVYEFQTAYCSEAEDIQDFVREFCKELSAKANSYARPVPVLPNVVNYKHVQPYINGLENVPIGVGKKSLNIATVNLANKVVYPIVAQDTYETISFTEEFVKVLTSITSVSVIDMEKQLSNLNTTECSVINGDYETVIRGIFDDMVERNNTYKDAMMDNSVLDKFAEKVYVIVGIKKLFEQLSADGKEKLSTLIEKAEAIYKIHFVIADSLIQFNSYNYEAWFKRYITGADGLWIGDGVADQYMLKVNKVTSDLYEEIGTEYGHSITRSRPTLVKILTSSTDEEVE